jgi:ElaB/YqjD/DUF883 family membrane-anchored ribosome-binding protein
MDGDGSTAEQLQSTLQDKTQQVAQQAQQVGGQLQGQFRDQLSTRSTQVAEQLTSVAGGVRTMGTHLRDQGSDTPARMVDQGAEKIDQLAGYLRETDADQILTDAEQFARQRPWVVALVGVAAGLAASRVLKASSQRRYESYNSGSAYSSRRAASAETLYDTRTEPVIRTY